MDVFSMTEDETEVEEMELSLQKLIARFHFGRGEGMLMPMRTWSEMVRSDWSQRVNV